MATRNVHKEIYPRANRVWSKAELSFVRKNIENLTVEQMAEKLHRSPGAVRYRMYEVGYSKSMRPTVMEPLEPAPEAPKDVVVGLAPMEAWPVPLNTVEPVVEEPVVEEPVVEEPVVEESVDLIFALDIVRMAYREGHVVHFNVSGLTFQLSK